MGEEEQGRKYSPAPATWWLATAGGAAELGKLGVVDLGEEQNWVEEQSSRGAELGRNRAADEQNRGWRNRAAEEQNGNRCQRWQPGSRRLRVESGEGLI
jgi:hypothetical protein